MNKNKSFRVHGEFLKNNSDSLAWNKMLQHSGRESQVIFAMGYLQEVYGRGFFAPHQVKETLYDFGITVSVDVVKTALRNCSKEGDHSLVANERGAFTTRFPWRYTFTRKRDMGEYVYRSKHTSEDMYEYLVDHRIVPKNSRSSDEIDWEKDVMEKFTEIEELMSDLRQLVFHDDRRKK